jgi:hypothetical protein
MALRGQQPELWRIYCVKLDAEAGNYAKQILRMFAECGFMVARPSYDEDDDNPELDRLPLAVLVNNASVLSPDAAIQMRAFDAAQIPYHVTDKYVGRTAAYNFLALRIGPRRR